MQEFLTESSVVVTVRMLRQGNTRLFLLVEGEEDCDILDSHFDMDEIQTVAGGGKHTLLKAASAIESEGIPGTIVLIDRDLDSLTGQDAFYPASVIATGGYDLLGDLLAADPHLIPRVIRAHGGRGAVESLVRRSGNAPVELVIEFASLLGALRYANSINDWSLFLSNFPVINVMGADFHISEESLIQKALERSPTSLATKEAILLELQKGKARVGSNIAYFSSHDVIGTCVALLERAGGPKAGRRNLESAFASAINCELLTAIHTTRALGAWAAQYNRVVFNCDIAQAAAS